MPGVALYHERFRVVGERSGALFAPHLELHVLELSRLKHAGSGDARVRRWIPTSDGSSASAAETVLITTARSNPRASRARTAHTSAFPPRASGGRSS